MYQDYLQYFHQLLASETIPLGDPRLYGKLPEAAGFYRILRRGSDWTQSLYVGWSDNLRQRVFRNHLMGGVRSSTLKGKLARSSRFKDLKAVKDYLKKRCAVQFVVVRRKRGANFIEHFLICALRPKHND